MNRYLAVLGLYLWCVNLSFGAPKDSMNISFQSDGFTLEGKLIAPVDKQTKAPAIIFLVGSGGSSSYSSDYKEFLKFFLESPLEREEVALLYFDKRGVGLSEGSWYKTDFEQRARDAKNAAEYLKNLSYIDESQIYVV